MAYNLLAPGNKSLSVRSWSLIDLSVEVIIAVTFLLSLFITSVTLPHSSVSPPLSLVRLVISQKLFVLRVVLGILII